MHRWPPRVNRGPAPARSPLERRLVGAMARVTARRYLHRAGVGLRSYSRSERMTAARRISGLPATRALLGLAVSLVFSVVTLERVDVGGVVRNIGRATGGWLLVGLGLAIVEVVIRAWRWQALLAPFVRVPYRQAAGYLCIGYFANTLLPVRLGDVARAYLAGIGFGASRLAVLGTVIVERVTDGVAVLLIAVVLGFEVAGGRGLAVTAVWLGVAGMIAVVALVGLALLVSNRRLAMLPLVVATRPLLARVALGATSLQSSRGRLKLLVSTLAAFAAATGALMAVSASLGISLSPVQAGLAMAVLALATAIPAAPSSVGTWELVGLSILVALGVDPEPALAAVVILHVLVTTPVALVGLALTWHYHFEIRRLSAAERTVES